MKKMLLLTIMLLYSFLLYPWGFYAHRQINYYAVADFQSAGDEIIEDVGLNRLFKHNSQTNKAGPQGLASLIAPAVPNCAALMDR